MPKLFKLFLTIIILHSVSACEPIHYTRNISSFVPIAPLKLKVPEGEKKTAQSPFMVAIVAPAIEIVSGSEKKIAETNYRKIDQAMVLYVEAMKKALIHDLQYILLQKSIRVLGSFKSWDEMTFDEKKRAVYTFQPTISIRLNTPNVSRGLKFNRPVSTARNNKSSESYSVEEKGYEEDGEIVLGGSLFFVLSESITKEKLWIKRFDFDEVKKPYKFVAKYQSTAQTTNTMNLDSLSGIAEKDNTDEVLVAAITEFYNALGEKIWKHIDPEEWEKYLAQVDDLRKLKRF